jgi:hypothetical protein
MIHLLQYGIRTIARSYHKLISSNLAFAGWGRLNPIAFDVEMTQSRIIDNIHICLPQNQLAQLMAINGLIA